MYAFLADDLGLVHLLHGVYFLGLFEFHAPDLPEPALADYILAVEVVTGNFLALQNQSFFVFFFIELGEIDFETIFDVFVGFLGNGGVAAVVFFFFFVLLVGSFFGLVGVAMVVAAGHDHAGGAVDADFSGWGEGYLECWAESCWLCWGIFMGSTLCLLFLWECRSRFLVGTAIGIDRLIFLKKLLTIVAEDFLG